MTTTKTKLLQTVRKHCLNCCGGSYLDVENCAAGSNAETYSQCALWPFRLGKDPEEPSVAMREKGRKISEKQKVLKQVPTGNKIAKIRATSQRHDMAEKVFLE